MTLSPAPPHTQADEPYPLLLAEQVSVLNPHLSLPSLLSLEYLTKLLLIKDKNLPSLLLQLLLIKVDIPLPLHLHQDFYSPHLHSSR